MNILFVTSEVATLFKRGGLADVSYALPAALSKSGTRVSIVLPFYSKIATKGAVCVGQIAVDYDGKRELVFLFKTILKGTKVPVYLIRHPLLLEYTEDHIVDRFAFFSQCVVQFCLYATEVFGGPYDIIHCNDWHTALIPLLLGEQRKIGTSQPKTIQSKRFKTILTIHNLLYTGSTKAIIHKKLGIPKSLFHLYGTGKNQSVLLLQEGMEYADVITTVSPTYAKEIMSGMHGTHIKEVFTHRKDNIIGILNGLDTNLWDPTSDPSLPLHYTSNNAISTKLDIKTYLQKSLGLPITNSPMISFVGRLELRQKGLDLIIRAMNKMNTANFQMLILGTGQKELVTQLELMAKKHPHISFIHTFDERLARRIYAGSDIMLVPSKFEPCGLTQLIAMRYGTLPIVRKTGGLADTVINNKNGFVFSHYNSTDLMHKIIEAIDLYTYKRDQFNTMIHRAMHTDFSWKKQVKAYKKLYASLLII